MDSVLFLWKILIRNSKCTSLNIYKISMVYGADTFSASEGELIDGNFEFLRVFFLMHQWFISNELLASQYMDLYPLCGLQGVVGRLYVV